MSNYAVFPQKVCNVTQSWNGTYNHYLNSGGSPSDYPMDIADGTTWREAFYAPCRMKCTKIYGQVTGYKGVANGAWFESTEPVNFPDGTTDYLTVKFVHMENDDFGSNGIRVGRIYEKYEYVGREGRTGNATGNHLHVTCGKGKMKGTGWKQNSKKQWVLQTTGGQFKPDQLLYIDRNFTTMQSEKNMTFKDMPIDRPVGKWGIGGNYRLLNGSNVYDENGNVNYTSADMSCVKVWDYNGSRYFICTTGWNGSENTVQEHAIGWVDESALEPWTQIHQIGNLVMYWGGNVFSSLNGIESGQPVSGPWTVAKIIDYKEGEHPYFIQDTHNGVYMGWVSEFSVGEYGLSSVTFAAQYAIGKHGMTDDQIKIYDLNGDGKVTLADVTKIAREAVK